MGGSETYALCSGSHVLSSTGYMYKGTMTVEFGGISRADVGRETLGVRPGVPPGVAGLGFLFWRIRRNSLKRPMILMWAPDGLVGGRREYERCRCYFTRDSKAGQKIRRDEVWSIDSFLRIFRRCHLYRDARVSARRCAVHIGHSWTVMDHGLESRYYVLSCLLHDIYVKHTIDRAVVELRICGTTMLLV